MVKCKVLEDRRDIGIMEEVDRRDPIYANRTGLVQKRTEWKPLHLMLERSKKKIVFLLFHSSLNNLYYTLILCLLKYTIHNSIESSKFVLLVQCF